ncbi:12823_t:CDS:2, partial [Ambispora leptoticha]
LTDNVSAYHYLNKRYRTYKNCDPKKFYADEGPFTEHCRKGGSIRGVDALRDFLNELQLWNETTVC